jgi:hypothetical protein
MSDQSPPKLSSEEDPREIATLRRMTFGAVCLLVVQSGIGMAANLYVIIPNHHSGAHPSNYFSGSVRSVGWAISSGAAILVVHAVVGFALVVMVFNTIIRLAKLRRRSINTWAVLGALFVIGAGFNGASFLDFNNNISSLLMALLAFASIICYVVVLFLLSSSTSATVQTAAPLPS